MTSPASIVRLQTPEDLPALTSMTERAFGPGRFARTAYRVRETGMTDPRLNLCATLDGVIIGAVQFTPVLIGEVDGALLLGPLIIDEAHQNQGHGLKLMLAGLERARELGYRIAILVGDLPYYARAGFAVAPRGRIALPGPVDPGRLLFVELSPGAIEAYRGLVKSSNAFA